MISIKDSLKLALIKFKTRKVRNLFSGCSVSLGILTIMVFLLASNAISSIVTQAYKDSLDGRYFVTEHFGYEYPKFDKEITEPNINDIPLTKSIQAPSLEEYRTQNSKYDIKNIFVKKENNQLKAEIEGLTIVQRTPGVDDASNVLSITTMDQIFIQDELYKGYNFEDKYNGRIPIMLPKDYMYLTEEPIDLRATEKEKFEKKKAILDKYIGKEVKVSLSQAFTPKKNFEKASFDAIIVGYHLGGSIFFDVSGLGYSVVIPNWAIENNQVLKENFIQARTDYIVEFQNKKQRDKFYEEKGIADPSMISQSTSYVTLVFGKLELFRQIIESIRNVVLGIGVFFLTISGLFILTTVGKIVSDSKKEIGVFRAIGGQKTDIMMIFFSFTFVLSTIGFILGLTIAFFLNTLASLIWGEAMYYQLISFGTTLDINKPAFIFVGTPVLEIFGLYLFTLLVGFIATLIPALSASNLDPIKALREE